MQVKSIAECSPWRILQYFRPSLSYHLSLRSLFFIFEWLFYTGFTVAQHHAHYAQLSNMHFSLSCHSMIVADQDSFEEKQTFIHCLWPYLLRNAMAQWLNW